MAIELGRDTMPEFTEAADRALRCHPWPGNVRQLKNVVERAVCRSECGVVSEVVFDPFAARASGGIAPAAKAAAASAKEETAPPSCPSNYPNSSPRWNNATSNRR